MLPLERGINGEEEEWVTPESLSSKDIVSGVF
jgi:hypothetical protein